MRPRAGSNLLLFACTAAAFFVGETGCARRVSTEEKTARAELRQALKEKAFDRATELARRVIHSAPHDDGAWALLAAAQLASRDLTGATQTFREWASAVPKRSAKFYQCRAELALAEGNRSLALQSWSASLALRPRNLQILRKVAHVHELDRQWSGASAAWTAVIKLQDGAAARISRANSRRHLRQWDTALDDLRHAQQLAPDDAEVQRNAAAFERLGKFLAGIRTLDRQLTATPNDAALLADRALLLLLGGDAELAYEDASAAAQLAPGAVRPVLFQGIALTGLGRAADCERLLVRRSLRVESLSPEFLETISRLDSEISAEPRNDELFTARAWQLNDIGQPALALQDAQTALRLDPKSAGACAESAYALMKLGRAQEAFDVIRRATDLDPNFSTAWQYRGELEMARVDYLTAAESLSRAIAINKTTAALQKREECYRHLGLIAKADQDKKLLAELTAGEAR
jgi:tetratricopeptide (TPR) repeat protein